MKKLNNSTLITILYNTHTNNIINKKNKTYLKLFEHYHDLVSNVNDEDLRKRIMYSHIRIESLLFNYISYTSKQFYQLGFNDLKNILFKKQEIEDIKSYKEDL